MASFPGEIPADTSTTATLTVFTPASFLDSGDISQLEVNGDHDWFKANLTAGHNYLIEVQGTGAQQGTLADSTLAIWNPAGTLQLAFNDDGGISHDSRLQVHALTSGTYFVDVGGFNNLNAGTYHVRLQDLGVTSNFFQPLTNGPSTPAFAGYGAGAGGWTSDNIYHRMIADVNGDGRGDIVAFGASQTYVSLSTGPAQWGAPTTATNQFSVADGWTSQDATPRYAGRVDGGASADIIGFKNDGVYTAISNGAGGFATATRVLTSFGSDVASGGWTSDNLYHRTVADLNGDGRLDIIGFGSNGTFVSLNDGNGAFGAVTLGTSAFGVNAGSGGWTSNDLYYRTVADVNGDRRADIVGFGASGTFVALGNGDGTFGAAFLASSSFGVNSGFTSQNARPRMLADINADGKADVVAFGADGVSFALGQADGTFGSVFTDINVFGSSAAAGGWTDFNLYPRVVADVTGDGAADIVGFGSAGVFVAPAENAAIRAI